MLDVLIFIGGFAAIFGVAYWYIEIYSARKHWREACEEVAAMRQWERNYRAPPRPPR